MQLGRLSPVMVREVWPHEANDFTPWLALDENIALLAEAIGLEEIKVEATEHSIGRFSADIIAKDRFDKFVLIENQIEQTDHRHLGQIMTYLAGLEGEATIIWISTRFLEEHRAAIDWLNANTIEMFNFFGIEIEIYKIGDSLPAPRFNVVAKPNNWSRTVKATTRQMVEGAASENAIANCSYWESFANFLKKVNSNFKINNQNMKNWLHTSVGRTGFGIILKISSAKKNIGVELYNYNDFDKQIFKNFYNQKEIIEKEFGEALDWQEMVGNKASRIALLRYNVDPSNEADRPNQHVWMLEKMEAFDRVFRKRIASLGSLLNDTSQDIDGPGFQGNDSDLPARDLESANSILYGNSP